MATLLIENPRRRRRTKKRKTSRRRRRRNPPVTTITARRTNPPRGLFGGTISMKKATMMAVPVVLGLVGSRVLSKAVLKHRDAGVWGYLANAVAAVVLGLAARAAGAKNAAKLITVGGVSAAVLRALSDQIPAVGGVLSGYPAGGYGPGAQEYFGDDYIDIDEDGLELFEATPEVVGLQEGDYIQDYDGEIFAEGFGDYIPVGVTSKARPVQPARRLQVRRAGAFRPPARRVAAPRRSVPRSLAFDRSRGAGGVSKFLARRSGFLRAGSPSSLRDQAAGLSGWEDIMAGDFVGGVQDYIPVSS